MEELKKEEKFIVLNKKHLNSVPPSVRGDLSFVLERIKKYIPENKYIVCNQDEPYAEKVWDMILQRSEKEVVCSLCEDTGIMGCINWDGQCMEKPCRSRGCDDFSPHYCHKCAGETGNYKAVLEKRVAELSARLQKGRDYLMQCGDDITDSDALEAFGFGRNGLKV